MSVTIRTGGGTSAAIVVKKADNLNIENLKDVVTTSLADGYTLIYDEETDKWVSRPISNVSLSAVDGGTY